jgi:hypothetical protein
VWKPSFASSSKRTLPVGSYSAGIVAVGDVALSCWVTLPNRPMVAYARSSRASGKPILSFVRGPS